MCSGIASRRCEDFRNGELVAGRVEYGGPRSWFVDEKLAVILFEIVQFAGNCLSTNVGAKLGDLRLPRMHEVVNELEWDIFVSVNGGGFVELVVVDLDRSFEVEIADLRGAMKFEALVRLDGFAGSFDFFAIDEKVE